MFKPRTVVINVAVAVAMNAAILVALAALNRVAVEAGVEERPQTMVLQVLETSRSLLEPWADPAPAAEPEIVRIPLPRMLPLAIEPREFVLPEPVLNLALPEFLPLVIVNEPVIEMPNTADNEPPPETNERPARAPPALGGPPVERLRRPTEADAGWPAVDDRSIAEGEHLRADRITDPPRELANPHPRYPHAALKRGLEGSVTVKFLIDPAGTVDQLEVLKRRGYGGFPKAVLKVLPKWHFTPPRHQGRPVSVWAVKTVEFRMSK